MTNQNLSLSPEITELLGSIHSPDDVKALPLEKLTILAQDIRKFLINSLSVTGGHLGSNLGVVELTIALHRVFNTPTDKILFDVSHQGYIHKILTGRLKDMHTLRQSNGISGFLKRTESSHDAFGAGHAGTVLSAALGICAARDCMGQDFHVIAVAGDASFSCGVTLEALNNIAQTTKRLIIILNDNKWAIDKNVGALANYFNSLQTSETYGWVRKKASEFVERIAGGSTKAFASKVEASAKGLFFPSSLFENLGLRYFGPLDGHDISLLSKTLRYIKTLDAPVLLHIITEKGRGYQPALDNPSRFHGLDSYCIGTSTTLPTPANPSYSEVFGQTLANMADQDKTITAITAAMSGGTKLNIFKQRHPERFYDVGIAEEHAAIFACGMATEGLKPYVAIYSTFMQRCVDMIQHDAALQSLPVRFCMDRAGLSAHDGPTHHGLFDIAMLRCLPDLVMMQPKDVRELVNMLYTINTINDRPSAIRYPKAEGETADFSQQPEILPIGKAEIEQEGTDIVLISLGNMITLVREVAIQLQQKGYSTAVINARFIKPLDESCFVQYSRHAKLVCTFEDHVIRGGFGSAVLECLAAAGVSTPVELIGWPDQFIEHGDLESLRKKYGFTADQILTKIYNKLQSSSTKQ